MPVQSDDALVPLQLHRREPGSPLVSFVGHADLVDYRSPMGDPTAVATAMAAALDEMPSGTEILFDSLPEEAAAPLSKAMAEVGMDSEPSRAHRRCGARPPRRSRDVARATREEGETRVAPQGAQVRGDAGPGNAGAPPRQGPGFDAFVELHRRAAGAKGRFLDDAMTEFFGDLAGAGFQVDLLTAGGRPVAGAFSFEDEDAYYLYNSAYEPDDAAASPGVMLLWCLVHRAIEDGRTVFDFLKGNEGYKFRLGAEQRPLYELRAIR